MADNNDLVDKIEKIINQADRGNGSKTSDAPNRNLAIDIVQRLQADGDLKSDPAK